MKYYGSVYQGGVGVYNVQNLRQFDNPYDALREANQEWESDPNNQIPRLLVVISVSDGEEQDKKKAYFQFLGFKSCEEYVNSQAPIEWTNIEKKSWNGDASFMT